MKASVIAPLRLDDANRHLHILEGGDEDVAERDDLQMELSVVSPRGFVSTEPGTNIFVLEMLEQLQLAVCPLGEHRRAERLHDLLDGDILAGELVLGRAVCHIITCQPPLCPSARSGGRVLLETYHTKPKAPMPTGWRSEYLEVISKVVPKIWARTNSAMAGKFVAWRIEKTARSCRCGANDQVSAGCCSATKMTESCF